MKLADLDPQFVSYGGEGVTDASGSPIPERKGIGLLFKCPCGKHDEYDRVFVAFANPIDGGSPVLTDRPMWQRTGETFDVMTLAPSIQRNDPAGCRWHGFIRNGEIVNA